MNRHALLSLLALLLCCSTSLPAQKAKTYIPWKNGKLVVSEEGRYLKHENGVPFFWLGETGWLMPQRLNRDEVSYYLNKCKDAGYNMVQVQVLNGVPSMNIYGQYSMTDGFNFKDINRKGIYGYWDHMDYIIKSAASRGIYIGMVCIWGTSRKSPNSSLVQQNHPRKLSPFCPMRIIASFMDGFELSPSHK